MPSLVELQYNPYLPSLNVLLNGKQPSDFSRLIQYSNEDIWRWGNEIFDAIYAEIRDDYVVSFTGCEIDAQILQIKSKRHKHCLGIKHREFVINESLQKRLGTLNQLVKKSEITSYQKTIIKATFNISSAMQKYSDLVKEIDINNLFCSVHIAISRMDAATDANIFHFIIAEDRATAEKQLSNTFANENPIFAVYLSNKSGLADLNDKAIFVETTPDEIIETLFECFLWFPLLKAFRNCLSSIASNSKVSYQAKRVSAVTPLVNVSFDSPVEVGKSNRLNITLDPPIGQPPKLEYKTQNEKISVCDGLNIYGKSFGETNLEIYVVGEKLPFDIKPIKVIKRNRISKLMLSENDLILGLDDKKLIKCDYAPTDADNVSSITWKSTNESVVKVDNAGRLLACGIGECRVICTAENVSAQCICKVKPYLSEIILETPLEENILQMTPMQEELLSLKTIPQNSIDGKLVVESSDYNIVNVVGHKLIAKQKGEATIKVCNSSNRKSISFTVIVGKPKRGFFQKIFGK